MPRPRAADLHLSIAHSLKTLGRRAESIEAYRAAAAARPDFGDAYWSLANLKTYAFTDEELARMRAEEASPDAAVVDRYHLCFALGKALEDRGEYLESYGYYERGNALKKGESRYPARAHRAQHASADRDLHPPISSRAAPEWDRRRPILFSSWDLPRSGSTLIEQILASHSRVEGNP